MDVRNCRSCGRLFNYLTGPQMCEGCKSALEEKFQIVKEYVRENRSAPINDVAENCDVSVKQLKQWVREERLIFSEDSGVFLQCEMCGGPIRMGRFCESCKNKLQGDLRSAYSAPAPAEPEVSKSKSKGKDRMRFLDK